MMSALYDAKGENRETRDNLHYMSAFTVRSLDLGTGLTTEQMLSRRIYENAGWDLDTVWMICEGDYPTLRWETSECGDP